MTTARDLQARLQGRLQQPVNAGSSPAVGKWPRLSVDLPPDVHDGLTRFAFTNGRVKLMHLGQALYELLLEDEDLQARVLAALPTLRRKADSVL